MPYRKSIDPDAAGPQTAEGQVRQVKTIGQIFRRDCKRIFRSPIAVVVLLGVIVLPCLYAWANIAAYHDPYQYTSGLYVAVASKDRGVHSDLAGEINAGEKVIESLKENDSLGWVFTAPEDAVQGVRSGDYYAAILIPETFSEDLLSVTTGQLRQPRLEYYVNEKRNAMAPLIMNVGANTLKNSINQEFIDAAVGAAAEIAQSTLDDLEGTLDSTRQALTKDLALISENLGQYETLSAGLQELLAENEGFDRELRATLDDVADAADAGQRALEGADQALNTGRRTVQTFSDRLDRALSDTADDLSRVRWLSDGDLSALNAQLEEVRQKTNTARSRLQAVADWNGDLLSALRTLREDPSLSLAEDMLRRLEEDNQRHKTLLQALQTGDRVLSSAAERIRTGASRIQAGVSDGQEEIRRVRSSYAEETGRALSERLDQVSYFLGRAGGLLEPVDGQIAQIKTLLDGLEDSLDAINGSLADMNDTIADVRDQLDGAATDLSLLANSELYQELLNADIDGGQLSDFLSSPVELKSNTFFPVESYGTAMAPLFTNLAIWVGGMVLLSLFSLEVDTDEKIRRYRPHEGYIGRGLLFLLVGLAQAVTVCLGDLLMLRIQCEHPVLFVLSGMLASFVYINLIYALGTTLKHIGKALCVVFLAFQIPSSSGTYPMEMTAPLFQVLHPILPFTYGVDAMRESLIGIYGNHYVLDLLRLLPFVAVALVLGLALRPLLINLNILFDRKLAETDLMICDEAPAERERLRITAALRLLAGREQYRARTEDHIQRFETGYQRKVRRSFRLALIVLPLVLMVLMFTTGGGKGLFLILWICSLIALMVFQIVVEYIREHLDRHRRMAEMTDQELLSLLDRKREEGKDGEAP